MKKIIFFLFIITALVSGCKKQTCYDCPHGQLGSSTYVVVCSDDWGPTIGNTGTWQTPPDQTYANYANCY